MLFAAPGLNQSQVDNLIKIFRNETAQYRELSIVYSDDSVAGALEQLAFNHGYLREFLALPEDLQPFESSAQAVLHELLTHPQDFAVLRTASQRPPQTDLSEEILNALEASFLPFTRRSGASLLMKRAAELDAEGRHEEEIAAYAACFKRYGASEDPEVQQHCARALVNMGVRHGQMERPQAELEAYEACFKRYGASEDPEVQQQCARALVNMGFELGRMKDHEAAIEAYEACFELYGASEDPEVQQQCARALVNKANTRGRMEDHEGAIEVYEACFELYGVSEDPEVQQQCARALFNMGVTHGRMEQHQAAIEAYEACFNRYGASEDPEVQQYCVDALQNSVEMALLLGWKDKAVARARQALEGLNTSDYEFAIMYFLIWLADPAEATPGEALAAIKSLDAGVKFDWNFQEIAPFVADLPPERQRIACVFIDHFEGRLDLPGLKTALEA